MLISKFLTISYQDKHITREQRYAKYRRMIGDNKEKRIIIRSTASDTTNNKHIDTTITLFPSPSR